MKPSKSMNLTVLAFIVLLHGCAFESPVLDSQNDRAGFVITKPPMQISYRGDMTPEAQKFTLDVIRELKGIPYKDYKFNENHNVRLNSVDAKSDKADINLHEHTYTMPKLDNEEEETDASD